MTVLHKCAHVDVDGREDVHYGIAVVEVLAVENTEVSEAIVNAEVIVGSRAPDRNFHAGTAVAIDYGKLRRRWTCVAEELGTEATAGEVTKNDLWYEIEVQYGDKLDETIVHVLSMENEPLQ